MADFLTLFSPHDALATKRVTAQGVEPAPHVLLHSTVEHAVASFDDLARVLGALVGEPKWYAVRGRVRDGVDKAACRRTHVNDPTLAPAAHRWLVLDLDHVDDAVAPETFAADPGRYAAATRARLPSAFHAVRAFWMATSSAGFKPGVRLRMAFWLDRSLSDDECKAWIAGWALQISTDGKAVDTAIFTPSQPHYTAAPVFDGVADPVPAGLRWGVLAGEVDTVAVPSELTPGSGAFDALERARRKIERLEEGERRNALNRTAFALAQRYGEDELPAKRIEDTLFSAGAIAGLPDGELQFTIANAVRDGRSKRAAEREGWRGQLARDGKTDNVKSTQANVTLHLEFHEAFAGRIGRHARTGRAVWLRSPDWAAKDVGQVVEDSDVARFVEWFQTRTGIEAKEAWIRSGLAKAAADGGEYEPIQAWLASRPSWDGQERLATVFIRHLGAPDTVLTRAFTVIWFIQAVRRPYATVDAPVKADHMIMLIGAQGLGKSTIFELLAPRGAFRSDLPDVNSKDARQAVADAWIIELSEFTQRQADANAFKAFTTATTDKYRPPYGRDEVIMPRRCVIAITTNDDTPLEDDTGNRRFFPIECSKRLDFAALEAERDQIWAEALELSKRCGSSAVPPELEDAVKRKQEEYRDAGAFVDAFMSNTADNFAGVKWEPGQLHEGRARYLRTAQACVIVSERASNPRVVHKVKAALKTAGWRERRVWEGETFRRAWYPPEHLDADALASAAREVN
jgi:hypothetical protein